MESHFVIPFQMSEVKTENVVNGDIAREPRQYFTIRFRSGDIWSQSSASKTIWSKVKDGVHDWSGLTPDNVAAAIKNGQKAPGKIKSWEVADYEIDGRTANTFTGVVLGMKELEAEKAYEEGKASMSLALKAYGREPRFVNVPASTEVPFNAEPVNAPAIPA